MNQPITVALIEDQTNFREALQELLARDPRFRVIGSYANPLVALSKLPANRPAVAVIDLNLPKISGVQLTERLRIALPSTKILILTAFEEPENIFAALRAGADGYLVKEAASEKIIVAIQEVLGGGAPMSSRVAAQVVQYFRRPAPTAIVTAALTPREQEVLNALAQGLAYKEIASKLGITFQTVSSHLKKIYEKLHVRSRAEAVLKLHRPHS